MEKKGYIKKVISDDDARVINLFLTEKGMELYTIFVKNYKKELAKIEKKLSAHDFNGVDEYVKQGLKLLMNA